MKQTLFNIQNLFLQEGHVKVHDSLIQLSDNIPILSKQEGFRAINIVDKSLAYVDEIEILLIFEALVVKGYLQDSITALNKLKTILEPLKYQTVNLVKFGVYRNKKSLAGRYNSVIVLPNSRENIFASNVKSIEYILADSNKQDDIIIKESDFNHIDYPGICLFEYNNLTNTLTHVDTKPEMLVPDINPEIPDVVVNPDIKPDAPVIKPEVPDGPPVITENGGIIK